MSVSINELSRTFSKHNQGKKRNINHSVDTLFTAILEYFEMKNPITCFLGLLMSELVVVLGGFGISGWLYSRVPDPRNIITILPLCFLG